MTMRRPNANADAGTRRLACRKSLLPQSCLLRAKSTLDGEITLRRDGTLAGTYKEAARVDLCAKEAEGVD